MPDLYVTKSVLEELLNSSRSLALVDNELAEALKGFETELYGFLSVQGFGQDLLVGPAPDEGTPDVEKISALGQHVFAVVISRNSSLRKVIADLSFDESATLPLVEADDAAQALGGLLEVVCTSRNSEAGALSSALRTIAAIRQDLARSEAISAGALQTLGLRCLGEPRLAASRIPAPGGPVFVCTPAQLPIRQILALPLANLTAVAVHIADAECGKGSSVKFQLISADSQISYGSWLVPGTEIKPGWLVLNLRSVIGPLLDSAALTIAPSLINNDRLAFSLDFEECEHRLSVDFGHGPSGKGSLCLQLFCAEFSSRNVLPRYWDWDGCGVAQPFRHAPHHLPPETWLEAEIIEGEGEFVAIGTEPPRPVIRVATGRRAVVKLSNCFFGNCDVFEVGLSISRSSSNFVRLRFMVETLSPQGGVETTSCSEWRILTGTDEVALFASRLPKGDKRVNLAIEAELSRGQGPVTLEWTSVTGLKLPPEDLERLNLNPPALHSVVGPAESEAIEALDVRQIHRQKQVFSGVRVDHIFSNEARTYRHIDIIVYDFFVGETLLPIVRFKLAEAGDRNLLEFRSGPDWPDLFETWPSTPPDAYGPVFHLESNVDDARALLSKFTARDRLLLVNLCERLVDIVSAAARDSGMDNDITEAWLTIARRMSRVTLVAQEE